MKKYTRSLGITLAVTIAAVFPSYAAWQEDAIGWWWEHPNGTWIENAWQWIDGNYDGIAECYYFNEDGYMLSNAATPDGYQVNADGAWVENEVIQVKEWVSPESVAMPEYVEPMFLTPNPFSRAQEPLMEIKGIVVHYVANPSSTAINNRNYFESLKDQIPENAWSASSHFIIGLDGEIIQCMPLAEISYASNHRNRDTISIECCHPDETGQFYDSTYQSLVKLTAYLCRELKLEPSAVIRHHDVTGKICPKYFVDHWDMWQTFLNDVKQEIETPRS